MSFPDAVRAVLTNYAGFSGRARRSEFWYFALFAGLVYIAAYAIDLAIGTFPILYLLAAAALLVPGLAVGVRRLHDTDRAGALILLSLIPIVGPIVLLVFFVGEGTPGENQYGPSPKAAAPAYSA